ncbi:nitrogen fixation protein FixF [Nioella aestuarii]|uniref:capsular polysaccharide export protein, LipB/KpsS family n=1 Tax=Nioella aestuarii TaxID=1662864 RepID=UPI003D7FC577
MARFLKLDTGVISGFDAALGPDVDTVSTAPVSMLVRLRRRAGLAATLRILARALFTRNEQMQVLVAGNVDRKRIRLPAVFERRLVSSIYGKIKASQARLLHELLRIELNQSAALDMIAIVYNGSLFPESVLAAVTTDRPRVFVEAGFFPGTLQIDPVGLNAANSVPRNPGYYRARPELAEGDLPKLVNNRPSKARFAAIDLDPGYVFVPFQVPSDMQVTVHSPWIRSMEQFLDAIIAAADKHSDLRFVIKEHPSFKRSVIGQRADHPRVIFANGNVTSTLIQNARCVVTLNSTVGIEGLLAGKQVITLGDACYNIEGLVRHAPDAEALDAVLSDLDWQPDEPLRRAFLSYLWTDYLVHGTYKELPDDLGAQIEKIAQTSREAD